MRTVTRYAVRDEIVDSKSDAGRRAREIVEEARASDLDLDAAVVAPRPVDVLVDAWNVVSERDGEIVIREVAKSVAESEAERLAAEQRADKERHPIHAMIPDESASPDGQPPAFVPSEPTPHPGYRVEPAPERVIETETEEA